MIVPNEGEVYEEDVYAGARADSNRAAEVVDVPHHTDIDDNSEITLQSIEDCTRFTVFADNFSKGWNKVADSRENYNEDLEDIADEVRDRARENWNKLAREFGISVEDVEACITGDV